MNAAVRWLILAAAVLLLANLGWWLLRDGGALPQRQVTPAPQANSDPSPRPAQVSSPVTRDEVPQPRTARAPAPVADAVDARRASPAGLLVPVQGVRPADLDDTFGDARGSERQHQALDIMAPAGTPVLAVADGHVEKLFDSERGGLTVYQFDASGRWCYYYAHLQRYAPGLAEGAQVRRGEVLGYVGSSGNADPAAPHLHFAVFELGPERQWWAGTPVNPYPLLVDAPPR